MIPIPDGFTYANPEQLHVKIARFVAAPSEVHFVFDFDRTITTHIEGADDDATTWHILHEHLSDKGKRTYKKLYEKNRILEIDGTMTSDVAAAWASEVLDLFVTERVNLYEVEKDLLARTKIRPGISELFELCRKNDIPIIIMSAGMRNIIDMWNIAHNLSPSLVISTELNVDDAGRVIGWQSDTLIHMLNKAEVDHPELNAVRISRPKAIVVGDGMGDADMASGDDDVLRVRIFNPSSDEAIDMEKVRAETFTKFDAMIETDDSTPLLELMHALTSRSV